MKTKICGISDSVTLKYLTNHPYSPQYIGFIVNYQKSKRFIEYNDLRKILKVSKNVDNLIQKEIKRNINKKIYYKNFKKKIYKLKN